MIDYATLLYDPIYDALGVSAVLQLEGFRYEVTALDKTLGVAVGERVEMQTITPAATVRVAELTSAGADIDDLYGGVITLNGVDWDIRSWEYRPAPTGEGKGEVLLLLHKAS